MCKEFFLAFLYFLILFFINFFLFQFVRDSFKKINFFIKIKKIFGLYNLEKLSKFSLLLLFFQKKQIFFLGIQDFNRTLDETQDILLIGNICQIFQQQNSKTLEEKYYFELLKNQCFLSS